MSNWNINTTVDLAHISTDKRVDAGTVQFVYGDNAAHTWNVTVLEDGAPADLSAYTANLYIRRADGATLVRDCTIEENLISVSFPSNAYRVTGPAIALIRIAISKTQKVSLSALTFNVQRLETDTIVDPEDIIPDINDLLAEIDAMEQAAADCEAAAATAEAVTTLLSPVYSTESTYAVGDYVTYNGALYRCTSAVSPPGAFNPSSWTSTSAGNDLTAVAEEVDDIKNLRSVSIASTWEQGTIATNTGNPSNSDYYIRTTYTAPIDVSEVDSVSVSYTAADEQYQSVQCYALRYNSSGTYLSYDSKWIADGTSESFDVSTAAFVRFAVKYENDDQGQRQLIVPSAGSCIAFETANKITAAINAEADDRAKHYAISNLAACWHRLAVVGDSLSAGRIYTLPDYPKGIDVKSISWPVMMARQLNNTVFNCSIHGQSPDTFIKGYLYDNNPSGSSCGLNCITYLLDGNHDVPLIVVGLGVNNHNSLETGSTADINLSDYTQNGDTKYGWFARMLQQIGEYYDTGEKPVTILLIKPGKIPGNPDTLAAFLDTLVAYIKPTIESAGFVSLDILDCKQYESMFNTNAVQDGWNHSHWTSIGYNAIGSIVLTALNDWMEAHAQQLTAIETIESNDYITSYLDDSEFM